MAFLWGWAKVKRKRNAISESREEAGGAHSRTVPTRRAAESNGGGCALEVLVTWMRSACEEEHKKKNAASN